MALRLGYEMELFGWDVYYADVGMWRHDLAVVQNIVDAVDRCNTQMFLLIDNLHFDPQMVRELYLKLKTVTESPKFKGLIRAVMMARQLLRRNNLGVADLLENLRADSEEIQPHVQVRASDAQRVGLHTVNLSIINQINNPSVKK